MPVRLYGNFGKLYGKWERILGRFAAFRLFSVIYTAKIAKNILFHKAQTGPLCAAGAIASALAVKYEGDQRR